MFSASPATPHPLHLDAFDAIYLGIPAWVTETRNSAPSADNAIAAGQQGRWRIGRGAGGPLRAGPLGTGCPVPGSPGSPCETGYPSGRGRPTPSTVQAATESPRAGFSPRCRAKGPWSTAPAARPWIMRFGGHGVIGGLEAGGATKLVVNLAALSENRTGASYWPVPKRAGAR